MKPLLVENRDKQRNNSKATAKNNIAGKDKYIHA
jgi:hypothetical protein